MPAKRSAIGLFLLAGALATAIACDQEDPCADYVDYICDCHADDPDFDCDEMRTTYEKANADEQDTCVIKLDKLQVADEEDTGFSCEA